MKCKINGIEIDNFTVREWGDLFYLDLAKGFVGSPKFYTSLNGNALSLSARNGMLKNDILAADGIDPDGMSIVFASRLLKGPTLKERVVTTDFALEVFERAPKEGLRVFLLGGTDDENKRAIKVLEADYPNIQLGGRDGYFSLEQEEEVLVEINAFKPDLLFVGMGVPAEQAFCIRNKSKIKAVWMKTCGGMFKVFAGDVERPSLWVQRAGLEWLYRCYKEPRHVIPRYLVTNPHSLYLIFKSIFTR